MTREDVERLLEIYTFDELIQFSDLDLVEVLLSLYNSGQLLIPEVRPL